MKRTVCGFLTAAALVGCQSPMGMGTMDGRSHSHAVPAKGRPMSREALLADAHREPSGKNPDIVQVGYNQGHGARQNNIISHQRVGRAVDSHPPFAGPGMPGPGGPGCLPGDGGMGMAGMGLAPRFLPGRTQIRFTKPTGMKIGWQTTAGPTPTSFTAQAQLQVPARYNFVQAQIYRLKVTDLPNRPGVTLYPTLEVYPGNVKVNAYLAHNAVPIEFSEEDFDQVQAGNFVTKVIYLPDPKFQELAIAGIETLVSTRLDPGVDPVQEAHRRGAILAVIRLGGVDLEMQHSPPLFPSVGEIMSAPPTRPVAGNGPTGQAGPATPAKTAATKIPMAK